MSLAELECQISPEQAEPLEDTLFELGAVSVELFDAADEPLFEPPLGTHPLWSTVRLKAVFPDTTQADLAAAALARQAQAPEAIQVQAIEDQDWVRAGLDGLGAIHCGGALWIVPSWEDEPAIEEGTFVRLDPGLAFGTGNHPTTAMCLAALAQQPPRDQEVLDYGCGSGILAIAALKLGACHALGIDIDEQAVQATRSNADSNAIPPAQLETGLTDHPVPDAAYDLVLANILAKPLIDLAPELARAAKPGARILLAGLLERQADEVIAAYSDTFDIGVEDCREGWALLGGRRR
ncbi:MULTISPECIES: 50S ribosomal protein L11 methyltransferase [unclassified Thioalkalivibrio]|uniref:50S ribosomal protein L11 methyltransferase n=1 Tax=unclassified Thioalkalivibrio TaxID=2621013 RepID=UPI00038285B8|nr:MULTISPECIES: 50S ribosomal protein L11 methyltransferase [unclassified Thioalkalivibrio]